MNKAIITCALTGVLTDPRQHPVPVTPEEMAREAKALGADALGFVFAPSRRQVKPDAVRDIVKRLPREITTVGVFRDDRPAHVVDVAARTGLHAVQLHGSEPRRHTPRHDSPYHTDFRASHWRARAVCGVWRLRTTSRP